MTARVRALETLLVDKGLVDPAAIDRIVETYEHEVGPRNGARVVARSWVDPDYRARLAKDATAAVAELGYGGRQGEHLRAVFNTPDTHNLVVCTLCSCYPWPVLGLPPIWYKSPAYRARVVAEPRAVLAEFGVALPERTRVRVWDSTAELRYLVVPERPPGTDGMGEDVLADLVTRDAMIGTGLARAPDAAVPGAKSAGGATASDADAGDADANGVEASGADASGRDAGTADAGSLSDDDAGSGGGSDGGVSVASGSVPDGDVPGSGG